MKLVLREWYCPSFGLPISWLSIVAIFYPSEYLLVPRISFSFSVTCCCDLWENVKRNLLLYYDLPRRNFWCDVSSSFHIFMRIFFLRKYYIIHSISYFPSLFHLQCLSSTMVLLSCSEYFSWFLSFCMLPTISSTMVPLNIISECSLNEFCFSISIFFQQWSSIYITPTVIFSFSIY